MKPEIVRDLKAIQMLLDMFKGCNDLEDIELIEKAISIKYQDFYFNEECTYISFKSDVENMSVSVLYKKNNWVISSVDFWVLDLLSPWM